MVCVLVLKELFFVMKFQNTYNMTSINKTSKLFILWLIIALIIAIVAFWNNHPNYMIYSMVLFSLLVYLVIRKEGYKTNDTPEEFFLYNREMPQGEFVPTYVTTNIGLFSSIAFSAIMGYYYGTAGMLFTTLAWFLGMFWFSTKIPKLLPFFKNGTTIHEFIANSYGKTDSQKMRLRSWTSAVSAILYFASVGVEVKFAADVFAPSLGQVQSTVLAFVIAFIGLSYTYLSGYKGVVITDKIQYYILLFGALIIFIFTWVIGFNNEFSLQYSSNKDFLSFPFILLGPNPLGLLGIILLLTLYQFCIMDMWQRCIAYSRTKNKENQCLTDEELIKSLKDKTFKKAIVPFLVLFIVWFGIGILALGCNLTNDLTGIIPAFLDSFNRYGSIGYFSKGIVITGFVAAVLSTIDTFLLATVQTLMYDIYGTSIIKGLTDKLDKLDNYQKYRFVNISKLAIVVIGISSIIIAFFSFGIMNFWTTMYSIMLAFFPAVYISINGNSSKYSYNSAFYSIVIGSGGALIIGITGTFFMQNSIVTSLAPFFAVFTSFIIIKILK